MIDTGVSPPLPFVPEVSAAGSRGRGRRAATLVAANDRGAAVTAMARGAGVILSRLVAEGGSTARSAWAAAATRRCRGDVDAPVGFPKRIVSTLAAGMTRRRSSASDITLMPSVVDISGINRLSAQIITNAAGAIAGMVKAGPVAASREARPLVAATMFGVTTPCVTTARAVLEAAGYEVLVFHATGTGGRTMEELVRAGFIKGVLDMTTTELADELAGGVLSAGPDRLEAAGAAGIPQVVSVGALDMVNFGARDTVPARYSGRLFYEHNALVTLMRTTPEENAALGATIAESSAGRGRRSHDPRARCRDRRRGQALPYSPPTGASRRWGRGAERRVVTFDTDINDPAFATAAARG
jgi:uncharacterized protein (UPF0261 family)